MDYVNGLAPGPLGGADVDQALAKAWVDKLVTWDGNLFLAANSAPGQPPSSADIIVFIGQCTDTPAMASCKAR